MPSMSMSGNINPQSSNMMRPSTSMHAQFRPISPSPPRNVTETGSGMKRCVHLAGALFGPGRGWAERQPALSYAQAERAHHRLGRLREHARLAVLVRVRLDEAGVDLSSERDVALVEGGDHLAELDAAPVRGHADDAARTDREQRQCERVVAAVDVEP